MLPDISSLFLGLSKSTSLRLVTVDRPHFWNSELTCLAANQRLTFHFYCLLRPSASEFQHSVPLHFRPRVFITDL